jgi:hypothetical protein
VVSSWGGDQKGGGDHAQERPLDRVGGCEGGIEGRHCGGDGGDHSGVFEVTKQDQNFIDETHQSALGPSLAPERALFSLYSTA